MSQSTSEHPRYAGPISGPQRLELPNVDQFVTARNVQGGVGLPEDRVAEGEGHRAFP